MIGVCSDGSVAGATPRAVAQFISAAAGDMAAVDAVEAALTAALAADRAGAAGGSEGRTQLADAGA
eukprot:3529408-Pleurochrysis_carterae.AAC.1